MHERCLNVTPQTLQCPTLDAGVLINFIKYPKKEGKGEKKEGWIEFNDFGKKHSKIRFQVLMILM